MKSLNITLWIILFSLQLSAQNPNWKVYTSENSGLPDLNLYNLAIDKNDIKWIIADTSIIRFDWTNWDVFNSSNSIIPYQWSGVIVKGGDGNAWIGGYAFYNNIGLVNISITPWLVYDTINSSLAYDNIAGLTPSRDGGIWINSWPGFLTFPGTVQKFASNNWYNSTQETINYTDEMEEDLSGNLWYLNLFTSGGVYKIDGDTTIWFQFLPGGATSLETDLMGNIWMSWYRIPPDTSGLIKYDGIDWMFFNQNNSGLPAQEVRNIVVDSLGNLWMSGDGLIKFDGINFTHYTQQNSGLYSTDIRDIQIDENNNKWIVHTNAISVFNEDGITSVAEEFELPITFKLYQNYPNPFNPATNIGFRISDFGMVILKVYDILGNVIATLINEEKPAGSYEVEFSGNELPSGIYFYQLRAGNCIETKKMVLMK